MVTLWLQEKSNVAYGWPPNFGNGMVTLWLRKGPVSTAVTLWCRVYAKPLNPTVSGLLAHMVLHAKSRVSGGLRNAPKLWVRNGCTLVTEGSRVDAAGRDSVAPAAPRRRRRRPRRTHGTAPGAAGPHGDDTDSTLSSVARALDHAAAQRAEVDAQAAVHTRRLSGRGRQGGTPAAHLGLPRRPLGGAAGPSALQPGVRTSEPPTSAQLSARACAQVRQGDLSRARRTLTSASLAPGDEATLAALSGPESNNLFIQDFLAGYSRLFVFCNSVPNISFSDGKKCHVVLQHPNPSLLETQCSHFFHFPQLF